MRNCTDVSLFLLSPIGGTEMQFLDPTVGIQDLMGWGIRDNFLGIFMTLNRCGDERKAISVFRVSLFPFENLPNHLLSVKC